MCERYQRQCFEDPERRKKLKVVPVRFVRACRYGHIGDIDWYFFLHGNDNTCRIRRFLFMDERVRAAIYRKFGFDALVARLSGAWRRLLFKRLRCSDAVMVPSVVGSRDERALSGDE